MRKAEKTLISLWTFCTQANRGSEARFRPPSVFQYLFHVKLLIHCTQGHRVNFHVFPFLNWVNFFWVSRGLVFLCCWMNLEESLEVTEGSCEIALPCWHCPGRAYRALSGPALPRPHSLRSQLQLIIGADSDLGRGQLLKNASGQFLSVFKGQCCCYWHADTVLFFYFCRSLKCRKYT